jgi:hypothetical protein
MDNKMAAGYFEEKKLDELLNQHLTQHFGEGKWILNFSNGQFFINHDLLIKQKIDMNKFYQLTEQFLLKQNGIANVYHSNHINLLHKDFITSRLMMGINQKRSGDIFLILEPGWIFDWRGKTGTTHGSPYNYDSHVPLLFFGQGVQKGETYENVNITDIAPTISFLIGTNIPNAATGKPIQSIFKK